MRRSWLPETFSASGRCAAPHWPPSLLQLPTAGLKYFSSSASAPTHLRSRLAALFYPRMDSFILGSSITFTRAARRLSFLIRLLSHRHPRDNHCALLPRIFILREQEEKRNSSSKGNLVAWMLFLPAFHYCTLALLAAQESMPRGNRSRGFRFWPTVHAVSRLSNMEYPCSLFFTNRFWLFGEKPVA